MIRLGIRREPMLVGFVLALAGCPVDPSDLGGGGETSTGMVATSTGMVATSTDAPGTSDAATTDGATSSGSDTDEDSATTLGSGTSTSGSETGVQALCESFHACDEPQPCGSDCGQRWSPQDPDGCPLQSCDDDQPCPEGFVCDSQIGWGGCADKPCFEQEDGCFCPFGLDCPVEGPGVCRREDVYPPPGTTADDFCGGFEDAESCNAVEPFEPPFQSPGTYGCRWLEGVTLPEEGTCGEAVAFSRCMYAYTWPRGGSSTCSDDPSIETAVFDGPELTVVRLDEGFGPVSLVADIDEWFPCDVLGLEAQCECACP